MPVIAVVNRKGGSGKSTLATHLAAHFANVGVPVMLGDVDKQQSTQSWLRSRALRDLPRSAPIVGWAVDPKRVLRPPAGVTHVVLDTPGGLRGFDLARVVAFADVIVMPVCNSIFDRESAAECFAELAALPRVASGRCKVAAIGMRLDARTKAADVLEQWARGIKLPFIGVLREAQAYVRCVEHGLTIFDLPEAQAQADVAQWKPITAWLEPVLRAVPRPVLRSNATVVRSGPPTDARSGLEHAAADDALALADEVRSIAIAQAEAAIAAAAGKRAPSPPATATTSRVVPALQPTQPQRTLPLRTVTTAPIASAAHVAPVARAVPAGEITDRGASTDRAAATARGAMNDRDAMGARSADWTKSRADASSSPATPPSSLAASAPTDDASGSTREGRKMPQDALPRAATGSRLAGLFSWLTAPRFLQRGS